jgi:hypothetical protein
MRMRRQVGVRIAIFIAVALGLAAWATSPLDLLMGNQTHTLDCTELPTVEQVQATLNAHADVVNEILQINPGLVLVDADNQKCTTKADVLITVGSKQDAAAVKALIHADTFFGIPYRTG